MCPSVVSMKGKCCLILQGTHAVTTQQLSQISPRGTLSQLGQAQDWDGGQSATTTVFAMLQPSRGSHCCQCVTQLNSTQLNSAQLSSTQLNSTQLNSSQWLYDPAGHTRCDNAAAVLHQPWLDPQPARASWGAGWRSICYYIQFGAM